MRLRFAGLCVVGLLALAGCGKAPPLDGAVPVYAVSGTLTHQGKSMGGAIVTFHPLNPTGKFPPAPSAKADENGAYKLTTYDTADGAPAGEYRVTVYWPGQRRGTPNEEGDLPPDQLREVYASKTTSKLRATVATRDNTIDFTFPPK